MTELSDIFHLIEQNVRIGSETDIEVDTKTFAGNIKDKIDQTSNKVIDRKDDFFMNLQTELFDILLEIHHLIPIWGSFKENFYFHWKRIIGASNIRELHAYRLIFRCLNNSRPSSTPIFLLKPIIKQLDEYRRISEPDYHPTNIDLNTTIQKHITSSCNSPIMFQCLQSLNLPSTPIKNGNIFCLNQKYEMNDLFYDYEQSNSIRNIENKHAIPTISSEFNKINETVPTFITQSNSTSPSHQTNKSEILKNESEKLSVNYSKYQLNSNLKKEIDLEKIEFENEKLNDHIKIQLNNSNNNDEKVDMYKLNESSKGVCSSINNCSNSINSTSYNSACSTSSLSPSEYNITAPIMAAFQHIQAVAIAAAVANQTRTISNSNLSSSPEFNISQPPKKRPRRNGEIQGVYFDKIRKLWRANWKENGRVKTKGFSVFQFGDEGARQKAIEYRRKMEKEFYVIVPNSKSSSSKNTCKNTSSNSDSEGIDQINLNEKFKYSNEIDSNFTNKMIDPSNKDNEELRTSKNLSSTFNL